MRSSALTPQTSLRVHDFLPVSEANGPGRRAVVWVQGCTLACPGCFNPGTHPAQGPGTPVMDLVERIRDLGEEIEGLTLSGGEPFQQIPGITALLQGVNERSSISTLVFTGFTWDEIQRIPAALGALAWIDVLITGRYVQEKRIAKGLLGSQNKELHLITDRYSPGDFLDTPTTEIVILPGGELVLSGIDPLAF